MNSDSHDPKQAAIRWPLPLAIALVALVAVIATLDSSGAVPQLGEGPGLTLDETFNVQMGVYHVRALREYGLALLHPDSVREVFGHETYNPDHPPLGRLLIGLAHELSTGLLTPYVAPGSVCVTCGRVASAVVYAMTILLIGWCTTRWYGALAGFVAATSMVLMPRLFAHAHLASLETSLTLTYVATVLWVANRWNSSNPPRWRDVCVAGVLWGLCLLTKMQAVLLPMPIALWALWRWRMRGVGPVLVCGLTGLAVFFVGWPWLWLNPVEHLGEYFGRATGRQTLYCWYAGQKWADVDVPWHYSLVMFAVSVPLGLQALGLIGACRGQAALAGPVDRPSPQTPPIGLLFLNVLWPVLFFALPGITVYDGARLFLMVFALWSILIGRGAAIVWGWLAARWGEVRAGLALTFLLSAQAYGVIAMHPVQLSYYNLAVGGLRGASRLGFEVTYWGDALTRSFLDEVEASARERLIDVAPVLHPFQLQEWHAQWPGGHPFAVFRPFDGLAGARPYVLVIRRRADSWGELSPPPPGSRLLAEVRREGVQLAALYALPAQPQASPRDGPVE